MCDKGMLEMNSDLMKLEYCIAIPPELQDEMVNGISKLIGQQVYIGNMKRGEYPHERSEWNRNRICITTEPTENWKSVVCSFQLKEMPGCCGILISHHTEVSPKYRNKGINSFLQGIKEKIARENGYTCLLATVTSDNLPQIHILSKYGWKPRDSFKNKRTGNTVITFTKHLED